MITIFVAKAIHTMEDRHRTVEAVAVREGTIVAVGSLEELTTALADQDTVIDNTFADLVVLPGLIDQHLHPLLGASTLATEVISIEDWVLPERTYPAARSASEYIERLHEAHAVTNGQTGDDWLFSWGYHELWHGPLTRMMLDAVSTERPIGIWQRSCHEWFMNTAGLERLGFTEAWLAEKAASDNPNIAAAAMMVDLDAGHFWEGGFFSLAFGSIARELISRERMTRGLHQMVAYLHQHGVTAFNEPGISWAMEPFDLYQEILGADETPLYSTFLVDARTHALRGVSAEEAIADAEAQVARAPSGKVSLLPNQAKMFADGAIISQMMQMRDPYLDREGNPNPHHHGEWLLEPEVFARYFRIYWDAGWQIHTHVNGDLGLDVVLDTIEGCMIATPRADHRSVIVHFANSTEEQIDRIARLGAIVSANPYYPCGFADKFGEQGLGPDRADSMVRSASVLARSIPLSFHSDLPMAPSEPLKLAGYAVGRRTQSGRVAAPEQRISVHDALRAVTIEAAYSWRKEHELGSIAPGKIANFTVLGSDPYESGIVDLGTIEVIGTVFEGRWHPVPNALRATAQHREVSVDAPSDAGLGEDRVAHHGCGCEVARLIGRHYAATRRAA